MVAAKKSPCECDERKRCISGAEQVSKTKEYIGIVGARVGAKACNHPCDNPHGSL